MDFPSRIRHVYDQDHISTYSALLQRRVWVFLLTLSFSILLLFLLLRVVTSHSSIRWADADTELHRRTCLSELGFSSVLWIWVCKPSNLFLLALCRLMSGTVSGFESMNESGREKKKNKWCMDDSLSRLFVRCYDFLPRWPVLLLWLVFTFWFWMWDILQNWSKLSHHHSFSEEAWRSRVLLRLLILNSLILLLILSFEPG